MLATRLCAILVLLPLAVSGLSLPVPEDPCKQWYYNGNTCNDTEVCRLVKVQCFTTPCEPQPQCVSVASAPKGDCDYGDPVIDASGNVVPCSGCPDTTECVGDSAVCCWQPPPPPQWPPCLLYAYTCPPGTQCVEVKKDPDCKDDNCELVHNCTAVEFQDPCKQCLLGEECLATPCQPDSPPSSCFACVATDPCQKCQKNETCVPTSCAAGSPPSACYACVGTTEKPGSCPPVEPGFGICPVECGNDSECPGTKKCCKAQCGILCTEPFTPEPMPYPCFLVDCKPGTTCRLQQGQCRDGPCTVEPACLIETEPASATCPVGLPVVDSSTNEVSCSSDGQCPDNTFCETESRVCCHRTTPAPYNPCIAALCLRGTICEARTPKNCLGPNCQPEAVCVPTGEDPCVGYNCKPGYHCEIIPTPCAPSDPPRPCPQVPGCVKSIEKPKVCPALRPSKFETCVEACKHDGDCDGDQKCCSNGCGHVCRDPVDPIPHPCTLAKCSRETECRLQMHCEEGICSVGASCVTKKCPYGWPLVGIDNVPLFCGRGPSRVDCQKGSTCNIDESDRFAVCCPDEGTVLVEKCPIGLPVVDSNNAELRCGEGADSVTCPGGTFCNTETDVCCHQQFPTAPEPSKCPNGAPEVGGIFCGRGPGRQDCPTGSYCEIHPADAYAVCCPNQVPEPSKCPNGAPEIGGIFCGRGPGRQDCPTGSYCEIDPTDRYAVCCPQPQSPCKTKNCKAGYRCEEVVHPCLVAPCPVEAKCVLEKVPDKNGGCPVPESGLFGHCAEMCTGDESCPGTQKCCSNGCGHTCQAARVVFDNSDPCKSKHCRGNRVCRLRQVRCVRGRCRRPLRPVCMAATTVAESKICKSGYPLIDMRRREISCKNCPENSVCDDGVCCWKKSGNSYHSADPCSKKVCGQTKVCQLKEVYCKGKLICTPKAICVEKSTVSDPSSCKSGYPVLDRKRRQICSHGDQTYCPTGTVSAESVCCWSPGKPAALPVQKVFVKPTYLPSDPCNKRTCRGERVCRLIKRPNSVFPSARCARKETLVGSKSCVSGYPVQDIGTWRPICCEASPDVCPKKTVCTSGVCCWDNSTPAQRHRGNGGFGFFG